MTQPYAFDVLLPQPARDECLSSTAKRNLHKALRTTEEYRAQHPQHATSIVMLAANIIQSLGQPHPGGQLHALYLIPATMREKAPKRTRRHRPIWRRIWRTLHGR